MISYEDDQGFSESVTTDSIQIEKHSIQSSIESLEEELEEVNFSYDLPSYLVEGYEAYFGEEYKDLDLEGYDRFGTNSADYLSSGSGREI